MIEIIVSNQKYLQNALVCLFKIFSNVSQNNYKYIGFYFIAV